MDGSDSAEWFDPPTRPRRYGAWLLAIAAVLLVAAYLGSPLLAIGNLKLAAKRGDQARLEQRVDFAALRASLKAQLAASIAARPRRDSGVAAAILLSDSFIDAVLTPSNLAALINGAAFLPKPASEPSEGPEPRAPAAPAGNPPSIQSAASTAPQGPVIQGGYVGLNRFDVAIHRAAEPGATVFSFRRKGLFGWRLSDIRLPPDVLARIG